MKKFLFTLVVAGAGLWLFWQHAKTPIGGQDRVSLTVEAGWSTSRIADVLKEKELIRYPFVFKFYTRFAGLDGNLQAGKFVLNQSQSLPEIAETLLSGKVQEITVTIPEGFTVKDIDAKLAELGLIESGEVIRCSNECDFATFDFLPFNQPNLAERGGLLEGYLYPDTYYVNPNNFVAKFFLERMLGNFRKQVVQQYEVEIASSEHSLHEIVTAASLVEEETRSDDERALVAGIIWKRYDAGWGLGIDAAVRYIVDKPTDAITVGDLNTNSPYNLRKFKGFSPGPIANPGTKSFAATLNPEESPYWYYLHEPNGQIHYAVSNEEHNLNRIKYLGKE